MVNNDAPNTMGVYYDNLVTKLNTFLTSSTTSTTYAPLISPNFAVSLTAPVINAATSLRVGGVNINTIYQPVGNYLKRRLQQ